MSRRNLRLITSLIIFGVFGGIQLYRHYFSPSQNVLSVKVQSNKTQATNTATVTKVIDGDTLDVSINGKKEKIRVIGINTPETVDPRKPVQCFGRQASDRAKNLLFGQSVNLANDPTQTDTDKYGRLLRYVYMSGGQDFGLEMIRQGYAYEYTYDVPYKFQKEYKAAQKEAENSKIGLWSDSACSGKL